MLNCILAKAPFLRLDPRPFDGETVGIQPSLRHKADILFIAVIMIAGQAAGLRKAGMGQLLLRPVIAVNIVALHLVGSGGSANQKALRKRHIKFLLTVEHRYPQ